MVRQTIEADLETALGAGAYPFSDAAERFDPLIEAIGDARFVLIGEATHGTHEFYRERAELTKRLVTDKGFRAVAVEADWPDACRVNSYVRHQSGAASADEALGGFRRFPRWMWRNTDVLSFVEWLRRHNEAHPQAQIGFYGLDLYSLNGSIARSSSTWTASTPRPRDAHATATHASRTSRRTARATNTRQTSDSLVPARRRRSSS